MKNYSVLDLSPIVEGQSATDAIAASAALAQAAEQAGYHRFWLAEHHNAPGIASAATSVMIGHIAGKTKQIRIGAGGIMLPNHAPLMVAEHFGTLASIYPNRIDLGLGRAPGTDMATARALRRHMEASDTFPQDVVELMGYFGDPSPTDRVRAYPGAGTHVPVWILGSSLYGAQLAAHLGLPYAFASHFAPALLPQAVNIYRTQFQPSAYLEKPYLMIAAGAWAAETTEEADYLRSSHKLAVMNLRSGTPRPLQPPVYNVEDIIPAHFKPGLEEHLGFSVCGTCESIKPQLARMIETYEPDEMIFSGMIYDRGKRIRSFEIIADVLKDLTR